MSRSLQLASFLLFSTALITPGMALAQTGGGDAGGQSTGAIAPSPAPADPAASNDAAVDQATVPGSETQPTTDQPGEEQPVEISAPGGDIVVTGRRQGNIARSQPQVISVLSSADIARTGEGDIAGALSRVTGLSVVGNGFVYVRGLGDRYSLALLNGSPLPSPEPLRRVVPLDIFPTNIVASSLVQKSYSVNYPGEFGGGVINLTTKSVPNDPFLTVGVSGGIDSQTTGLLGYTYYGSKSDWTGFDNGERDLPPAFRNFLASGQRIDQVDSPAILSQLVTGRNSIVQRNGDIPPNWSADLSGGISSDLGAVRLGVIGTFGYSNKWRTRDTIQQTAGTQDLSLKELDFRRVITDSRTVVDSLLGVSAQFDENLIRLTGTYIRDTLKQARLGQGTRQTGDPNATYLQQDTAWFERQLFNSQLVGEFKVTPELSIDLRGGFANTQREAPDEFSYEYIRSNRAADPYGNVFINRLNNGQQGNAEVSYSYLTEDLYSAAADVSYKIAPRITATVGYAFSDTDRRTERRSFLIQASNTFPTAFATLRPDVLLSPGIVGFGSDPRNTSPYTIRLVDNEPNPVFRAKLRNHAAYAQLKAELIEGLSLDAGVRYETAKQTVAPVQVYTTPSTAVPPSTALDNDYWLPAATLTWEVADRVQVRLNGSKTIARPQFRELVYQNYFDPETNRLFFGNPRLRDSQLYNAELRGEWYFAPEQRLSIAGFYKRIDNPIETYVSFSDNAVLSSFANAPKADLYGGEIELQKYFPLEGLFNSDFLASQRLLVIANYTYTKSKLKVREGDTVDAFPLSSTAATDFFRDGAPLTGQSDHLVNLQLGIENKDKLQQMTFLLSYASDRVTNRAGGGQPDIKERPGIRLDFVAREGLDFMGLDAELKFEVRNITGTKYQEFQELGENRIYYNRYDVGTTASVGVGFNF